MGMFYPNESRLNLIVMQIQGIYLIHTKVDLKQDIY